MSKFYQILLRYHVLTCCSDPISLMWTKISSNKWLDPKNKPVTAFLKCRKIDLTGRGQILTKFDPEITFCLVVRIRHVRFGHKFARASDLTLQTSMWRRFWNFPKFDPTRRGRKSNFWPNLTQKSRFGFSFRSGIVRYGQKLARIIDLTVTNKHVKEFLTFCTIWPHT
jgi:hypothetical protein